MQCQKCKKKQATVHMTEIMGEKKEEIHLCEECAQEHGLTMKGQVSLSDFLTGLIKAPITQEMSRLAKLQCPSCGISYLEFQSKGRFGCPKDYEVFAKLVEPLLDKVHGAVEHAGKFPVKSAEGDSKGLQLTALRRMLKSAVDDENYEEAAAIRDQIRKLEGGDVAAD